TTGATPGSCWASSAPATFSSARRCSSAGSSGGHPLPAAERARRGWLIRLPQGHVDLADAAVDRHRGMPGALVPVHLVSEQAGARVAVAGGEQARFPDSGVEVHRTDRLLGKGDVDLADAQVHGQIAAGPMDVELADSQVRPQ